MSTFKVVGKILVLAGKTDQNKVLISLHSILDFILISSIELQIEQDISSILYRDDGYMMLSSGANVHIVEGDLLSPSPTLNLLKLNAFESLEQLQSIIATESSIDLITIKGKINKITVL